MRSSTSSASAFATYGHARPARWKQHSNQLDRFDAGAPPIPAPSWTVDRAAERLCWSSSSQQMWRTAAVRWASRTPPPTRASRPPTRWETYAAGTDDRGVDPQPHQLQIMKILGLMPRRMLTLAAEDTDARCSPTTHLKAREMIIVIHTRRAVSGPSAATVKMSGFASRESPARRSGQACRHCHLQLPCWRRSRPRPAPPAAPKRRDLKLLSAPRGGEDY